MTIKLFQNQVCRNHWKAINRLGHLAEETLPAFHVHDQVSFKGSKAWKPEYFAHYAHVSNIEVDDLEVAFSVHNALGAGLFEQSLHEGREVVHNFNPAHSMSVGDIVEKDGEHFIVDGCGFEKVQVKEFVSFYKRAHA